MLSCTVCVVCVCVCRVCVCVCVCVLGGAKLYCVWVCCLFFRTTVNVAFVRISTETMIEKTIEEVRSQLIWFFPTITK